MPGSGPSGVGISMSPTVVQSQTSVSAPAAPNGSILQSSTFFLSTSSSAPIPGSTDAVQTADKLPMASSPQTVRSSTPSASRVDSSFSSSPVSPATSPTNTFIAPQQETDAWHPMPPPRSSSSLAAPATAPAPADTLLATMPSRSAIPSRPHPPEPPPSVTQSDPAALVSPAIPSTYSPSNPSRPTPDAGDDKDHHDGGKGESTSDPVSEPMPTSAPISTPASISHMLSGETIYTDSKHYFHPFTERPKRPQQIVSKNHDWVTVVSQTTDSETVFQTTLTSESIGLGSLIPVSTATTTNSWSPHSPFNSNNLLPLILGVVMGTLALVALATAFFRCRGRGRSKYTPTVLSYDPETSREQKDSVMTEATPRAKAVTRIAPYWPSSTYAPEHVTTRISHAGESFHSSDGPLSDPFADSSTVLSSRSSMPPASLHSVDSVSTNLEITMSVNTHTREGGETGRLIDESTSSLELYFVPPPVVARRDSLTRSPYWSPTWHYDGQSPELSSSRRGVFWNEERGSGLSDVTTPTSSRPFLLGAESARLRLHALLKEARRA